MFDGHYCPPEVAFLMINPQQAASSKMRVFADLSVSRWRVMEVPNAEVYLVASDVVK